MANDGTANESSGDRWEVGSEFHWCGLPASPFLGWPRDVRWYMLARHAIAALIGMRATLRPTLWLPSYFCPEVAEACRLFCDLREYSDDPRWTEPKWSSLRPGSSDFVLAVNYFGVREGGARQHWRERHDCVLVEDHTQDLFSPWFLNSSADYALASLRKTVPVPDGAMLWSPRGLPLPPEDNEQSSDWSGSALKLAAMFHKAGYLQGQGPDDLKPCFRDLQLKGEQLLGHSKISAISPYSRAYLANGVPRAWRQQRLENAQYLLERLDSLESAELVFRRWPEGAVPFVVLLTFLAQSERDACQASLRRRNIYCPVHWVCQTDDVQARDLSSRILSLPIDQRYGRDEMRRMAAALHDFHGAFAPKAKYVQADVE